MSKLKNMYNQLDLAGRVAMGLALILGLKMIFSLVFYQHIDLAMLALFVVVGTMIFIVRKFKLSLLNISLLYLLSSFSVFVLLSLFMNNGSIDVPYLMLYFSLSLIFMPFLLAFSEEKWQGS